MDDRSEAIRADEESFEAIEQAVMETARGRWFLAEFATRTRQANTEMLLKSISRLERVIAHSEPLEDRRPVRIKLSRLISDFDTLMATLVGEPESSRDAAEKLTAFVMEGEKSSIEMAVVADAARDVLGQITLPDVDPDDVAELDHQLSELVRLAADHMASMRRFEALAEIHRHVRARLSDMMSLQMSNVDLEHPFGPPANDHFPDTPSEINGTAPDESA